MILSVLNLSFNCVFPLCLSPFSDSYSLPVANWPSADPGCSFTDLRPLIQTKSWAWFPQLNWASVSSLNQAMSREMRYTDWPKSGSHSTLGVGEGVILTQNICTKERVGVDTLRKNHGALTRKEMDTGQAKTKQPCCYLIALTNSTLS